MITKFGRHTLRLPVLAAAVIVTAGLLTGCTSQWWVPQPPVENNNGLSNVEASAGAGGDAPLSGTVLSGTVTDLPTAWNAAANANNSPITLPNTIESDDATPGSGSATIAVEDYTVTLQWASDTGVLQLAQIDGPATGELVTSDFALVGESVAAGALGLTPADAKELVTNLITTSEADPADPTSASGFASANDSTVSFFVSDGQGSWIITPGA